MPVEEGCFRFLELELAAMAASGLGVLGWRGFFLEIFVQRDVFWRERVKGAMAGKGQELAGKSDKRAANPNFL